ncbi:ABC transporter permease [Dethiothermospora halolimnae]|uniref:ABC transporter permease n=1 Tax=Dethiothermospora halolimnae TaxID=3114390 RepID=UPI003CCBC483
MKDNKTPIKGRIINTFKGTLGFTLISIVFGLIVGAIALKIAGFSPIEAYKVIFDGVFGRPKYISYTIVYATPLIITGLSVSFAFRTGLFNIGAEGQFIVGSLVAAAVGLFWDLPIVLHAIVAILLGALAAGLWGAIAGYLKSRFGVHEVIATIMLNWIALYLNNYFIMFEGFKRPQGETTMDIQQSASIGILEKWKYSKAGREWLKDSPILRDIFGSPVNLGIIIAIILAVIVWYILKKTTLGYELRAVGFNKYAAEYGGINVKKSMVTSMFIAGALSGIAGTIQVLGVNKHVSVLAAMEGYGFDGIGVALIGGNTAIGSVLGALLFGGLKYGGSKLNYALRAPSEIVSIVIGTIVFFVAIPKFIKWIGKPLNNITKYSRRKRGEENGNE